MRVDDVVFVVGIVDDDDDVAAVVSVAAAVVDDADAAGLGSLFPTDAIVFPLTLAKGLQ